MATTHSRLAHDPIDELGGLADSSAQFGTSLVIATVVASPALLAGAMGRQPIPVVLGLYLLALVVVWVMAGLLGGALALFADRDHGVDHQVNDPPESDLSPPQVSESVGSNGAH
jgi:hypothetical protein